MREIAIGEARTWRQRVLRDFRTNRRTCGTCHLDRLSWTITPEFARNRSTQMLEFANVRSAADPGSASRGAALVVSI